MNPIPELDKLEASGLIVPVPVLDPDLEYLFRHALVQDAAYASLLKQDRRTLHRLAAETLLATYPGRERELASVVAMHFEQAGDAAAATEHLVVAGEHAVERFANREALLFFERALALLPVDDPRMNLRLRATIGKAKVGWSFTASASYIDELERLVADVGERADPRLVADAYFWIAFLLRWRGEGPDSPASLRAVENAARIGEKIGDPIAQAIPQAFLGLGQMFSGRLREGTRNMSEALAVMEGKADPLSTAILSGFLTMGYARLGDFAAAEESLERGDRLAARGDEIARLDAMLARTTIELERGDLKEGAARAAACALRSEELGATACAVGANMMLGVARLQVEDVIGAKVPVERGLELSLVTNQTPMRTIVRGLLGAIHGRLGDLPTAAIDWSDALTVARGMGDTYGEAVTLWNRGRTHARQAEPDPAAALPDLDAAAALFEKMEARPAHARVLRDRAQTLRDLGRGAEADEAALRSRTLARELGLKDFS